MAKPSDTKKLNNLAGFIKRQASELLYKLNQFDEVPVDLFHSAETLCEIAETTRQQVTQFTSEVEDDCQISTH